MAETIKEFLVSLSWKNDEAKEKQFVGAIEGATLKATLMGAAIEEAARKVYESVIGIAQDFDKLYYASARIHSTVANIQAFIYAATQMGVSADDAQASLQKFSRTIELNPGEEQHLNQMGVQTRINGVLKDRAEILRDFGQVLSRMPPWQQQIIGMQEFGLSYTTMMALMKGGGAEFGEHLNEKNSFAKMIGFDPDQAAKDAHEFQLVWTKLFTDLDTVFDKFETGAMKRFTGPLQSFDEFMKAHGPEITDITDRLDKSMGQLGADIGDLVSDSGGKVGLTSGSAVLKFFGDQAVETVKDVDDLVRSIKSLVDALADLFQRGHVPEAFNWLMHGAPGQFDPSRGSTPGLETPGFSGSPSGVWDHAKKWWSNNAPSWLGGGSSNKGVGGWWTPERMRYAAERLQKEAGLSEVGAAGLVARWAGVESPGGPTSSNNIGGGHWGVGQWDRARGGPAIGAAPFEDQITHAVQELNTTERRAAETLRNARTAMEAAAGASQYERAEGWNGQIDNFAGSTPVERVLGAIRGIGQADHTVNTASPTYDHLYGLGYRWGGPSRGLTPAFDTSAMSDASGAGDVVNSHNRNLNATATINVYGSGNASEAAAMVGYHIERTNQDWSRFLQGAAQ